MDFGTMMDRIPRLRRGWLFTYNTQVDWRETYEAHILKADMPGFKEEDVRVQVLGSGLFRAQVLEIKGERKKEESKEGDTWLFTERPSGDFSRKFKIPYGTNIRKMHAHVQDGVLTVEIPKSYSSKPIVTPIDFS
ncbi:hypothetical protein M758_6G203700 [Ceratodon purpureus]|uniref:SHSP domain-containing protein n=1 Tax=Ceratodon purpureus TaxID=3225 RepID=A0A8T0HJY9_CERPU|nr:hypothetical protein KC19_6G212800 [Ceratodon purpureus]KAG0614793.1 hypothetical protein M758_6G203700 [Ceratodon purpureus]